MKPLPLIMEEVADAWSEWSDVVVFMGWNDIEREDNRRAPEVFNSWIDAGVIPAVVVMFEESEVWYDVTRREKEGEGE